MTQRVFALCFLVGLIIESGCSSSSDSGPKNDANVYGIVTLYGLDGKPIPTRDSVTVHLDFVLDTNSYTTRPSSNGFFAFRNVREAFYSLYATRSAFGYSNILPVQANILSDTLLLSLYQTPTVTPTLDSVSGTIDSGFKIYVTIPVQAGASLGLLLKSHSDPDSAFVVWGDSTAFIPAKGKNQFVAHTERPATHVPGSDIVAAAYNAKAGEYRDGYGIHFSSQGPFSNIVNVK